MNPRRVLIVSPHFPPSNVPDHQRVRLILPYLRENGWHPEVLAVDSAAVAAPLDVWMVKGLPAEVPVHRVQAWGLGWARIPSLGTLTFRALGALRRQGDALLKSGRFDLVYFSTTRFGLHVLGPRWRKKFGVPFVMDYQDPWVNDYYREHPEVPPPGGRLKFAVSEGLNRRQEPRVLQDCAGITSVSAGYPGQLSARYPALEIVDVTEKLKGGKMAGNGTSPAKNEDQKATEGRHRLWSVVLPFPGDEADLRRVSGDGTRQNIFSPGDGCRHWVYAGGGGQDMGPALRGIFGALQLHARTTPGFLANLRLHFIGTSYAAAGKGRKTVEPLAAACGLNGVVHEYTSRLPYSETMRCLLDADALIVPGSNDPAYTASKIYPYLLARKPLLAVFHENSSVISLLQRVQGGVGISFRTGEPEADISARIVRQWLAGEQFARAVPLDEAAFAPHGARAQAGRLAEFFTHCRSGK
jgi:hypothetical protein